MDPDDHIIFECAPLIRVHQSGRVERCPEATATTPRASTPLPASPPKTCPSPLKLASGRVSTSRQAPRQASCRSSSTTTAAASASTPPSLPRTTTISTPSPQGPTPSSCPWTTASLTSILFRPPTTMRSSPAAGWPPTQEQWLLDRGDFGRLFVAGDSAGANIAHNVAMRARDTDGASDLRGVSIAGLALVHPYFLGSAPVESEAMNPALVQTLVEMWRMVCGSKSADVDDPRINPLAARAPSLGRLACMRVLVCAAEKEVLKDRAKAYCRVLGEEVGGDVEFYEATGEGHNFHIADPKCEGALAQDRVICSFINQIS